jgi:hypothetical protein
LLLRVTIAVPVGTPLSVTVQVVGCPVTSPPGVQLTEDSCTDTRLKLKICDTPFAVAVNTAVWFELMGDTVAVKPAVVAPAATVTFAGTVAFALLLDSVTTWPPPGAALLSVTVQAEVPGAFTLTGEQATALGTGGAWTIVMVPPEPDAGIELPTPSDATIPLTLTGTVELAVPAEIEKVAEAIDPLGIAVVFSPKSRQVVDPLELKQDKLFDTGEAVTAGFATTVTPVTAAAAYVMVHWRLAGSAPPDATVDSVKATADPGVALPDDTDTVTCGCALARLRARMATPTHNAHRVTEVRRRPGRRSEICVRL